MQYNTKTNIIIVAVEFRGHFLCLGFPSVFNTVDHSLLIQQLETSFGNFGSCLKWSSLYLSNKSFVVSINNFYSTPFPFGVSQSSVLGLLLLIMHTSEHP